MFNRIFAELSGEGGRSETDPTGWERLPLDKVQVLFVIGTPAMDRTRLQQAHAIAANSNDTLAKLGAPSSGFFDQMLPTLEQILAMLPE